MESWLPFFVIVAAVAIILQMGILLLMYLQFRQMNERMTRIATDLQNKVEPILSRVHDVLEDSHGRITSMVVDASEVVHLARNQAQKVDALFTESVDRLRLQVIRADQLLTTAMEQIEQAGTQLRQTVLEPVQKATAFIRGVQAGLEVFRGQRHSPERVREHQDEELFI
jgi:hypothetical protein